MAIKKTEKLTAILKHLYVKAHKNRGEYSSHKLPGGLKILLRIMPYDTITLGLMREGVYPSGTEWRTTFRHWSYPHRIANFPKPSKMEGDGNYYLYAHFGLTKSTLINHIEETEKSAAQILPMKEKK